MKPAAAKTPPLPKKLTPLDYMLGVINDPEAEAERRDRLAIAAAPFVHVRVADTPKGKRDSQKEAAAEAMRDNSPFATPAGPKLIVHNK